MSFSKVAWLTGGACGVVVASALGLAACSSSSSGNPGTNDSGASGGDSSSTGDTGMMEMGDTGTGGDTSVVGDGGTTGDTGTCESPPSLFKENSPGVYCPFSSDDAGNTVTCAPGQHCCETPAAANTPSTCQPMGTPCPVANSVDWQCEEAIDCTVADAGGPICCGMGTATTATHCGITWPEWSGFTGTQCMASCPAPGITVCEQASDCTTDGGCAASKAQGNDFGFCAP